MNVLVARLLLPIFAALFWVLTAHAADISAPLTALSGDDFAAKVQATEALGAAGEPAAVPALKALADGRLYRNPADGRTLYSDPADAARLIDAITGQPVTGVDAASLDKARINNRLRGAITNALAQLTLFSSNPAERLAAAQEAFKNGGSLEALRRAAAAEKDARVVEALALALAAAELSQGSEVERAAAIDRLAATASPATRGLIGRVADDAQAPQALRDKARAALVSIERTLWINGLVANLFQGISLGSVLLLAAIGLAITFGVMGVINMAHGEMIMLGAYSTYVVQEAFRAFLPAGWFDLYLIAALPVAFFVAGAVGFALERGVIRFLYSRPLETLLATWGISLILQQVVRSIFGAPNKEIANPSWMTGGFEALPGFFVTYNRIAIIIFCLIVLAVVALILRRTAFGLEMRAVTQNRRMASAIGIATDRVDALTFALGSGIAGMAGVALSQIGNVSPNLGQIYIIDSFLVVVFGGVGNLLGTLVGAMTLGVVNKILEPVAGAMLGKIVVLVAIILFMQKRPRGLFALKGRSAEA
ncbi:MAG: urea ABC transporter permease subunit UrtB [Alphaproteobacteria bacterium]|jgi:urea transport system permease protein|nr:urea ABC transporter permease subunit UrtB [Alphaproteobacteria bacterium]